MSENSPTPDANNVPVVNPTPANTPAANPAKPSFAAPQPGGRRPGGNRPFPKGDRPKLDGSTPPVLDHRDFAALKPNKRELDQAIEDELAAAMAGMDSDTMLAKAETQQRPQATATSVATTGRKRGTVLSIHGKDVFIDIPGGRSQGLLPIMQFEGRRPEIGEEVEFAVERYDSANGLLILTREGAAQTVSDWSSVAMHMVIEAKVTGLNKNRTGLMMEVNGLKGFMPISQVDLYRVEQPEQFVNQTLKCQVIELDREERNLLLSRRAVLEKEREAKLEEFWKVIQEGQTRTGIVRSLQNFGAFVDLGGADGLIPISEMSWQRVKHPSEILEIGQRVEVVVHRLDHDARKIALSLRQLLANPWDDYTQKTRPGSRVSGPITRITEFGAFVELAPGVEGLIHVSELSTQRVRRVRDIVSEGQNVEVQILTMDPDTKRIGLSLRTIQAGEEAITEAAAEAERLADLQAAEERSTQRPINPNLRGGIGSKTPFIEPKS